MLPSAPLIHARLGWRETVLRAGLTPRESVRRTYKRRWPAETCRHALRRIVVETGEVPTVAQYEALAQVDDSLPSVATVRNRLGRWSTITADLARLPTREEALARVVAGGDSIPPTSGEIWMAYLDEVLSHEDAIVLLISGDLCSPRTSVPPLQSSRTRSRCWRRPRSSNGAVRQRVASERAARSVVEPHTPDALVRHARVLCDRPAAAKQIGLASSLLSSKRKIRAIRRRSPALAHRHVADRRSTSMRRAHSAHDGTVGTSAPPVSPASGPNASVAARCPQPEERAAI